ncbi:MAG: acylphosphatase [Opitutales bacterium]
MATKHLNIRITGKVQGVNYRDSARDYAEEIGVKGFVRNEPDGSVHLEAEADEDTLQRLMSWLREGPSAADVAEVIAEDGPVRDFTGFSVEA